MEAGRTIHFDRDALFDEVWAEPVQTVSKRYGMSGVALRKVCLRLCIPVPGRGYWAKQKAGKPAERPQLPEYSGPNALKKRAYDRKRRGAIPVDVRHEFRRIRMEEASADARISVRRDERFGTSLVRELAARLANLECSSEVERRDTVAIARRVGEMSIVGHAFRSTNPGEGYVALVTSQSQRTRAMQIADALIIAMRERGFKVKVVANRTLFSRDGFDMSFRLSEMTHTVRGLNERQVCPSGKLRLILRTIEAHDGVSQTISAYDQRGRPLETQLNDIAMRLRQTFALFRYVVAQRELEEALASANVHRRLVDDFFAEADAWERASRRRLYIRFLRERAVERGVALDDGSDAQQWLAWAERICDQSDPSDQRLAALSKT